MTDLFVFYQCRNILIFVIVTMQKTWDFLKFANSQITFCFH